MVQVTAAYPGADPGVVADTVAASIEQEVNSMENMLYMSSTSASTIRHRPESLPPVPTSEKSLVQTSRPVARSHARISGKLSCG